MRPGFEVASTAKYKDAAWPNIMAAMGVVKIREAGDEVIRIRCLGGGGGRMAMASYPNGRPWIKGPKSNN